MPTRHVAPQSERIERARATYRLVPLFTNSCGKVIASAVDLDLSEIAWHLRCSTQRRTTAAEALSRYPPDLAHARNELAHRRPLPGSTIQAAFS